MKVLLCERSFDGHREKYFKWLSSISGVEFYGYSPENVGLDSDHYFKYREPKNNKSYLEYILWIKKIKQIINTYNIDVVHFLDGDSIMRYFGLGFPGKNKCKVIITYHHFYSGFLRKISYKYMLPSANRTGIVHTMSIREAFRKKGIKNIKVCEYPAFEFERLQNINVKGAKAYWKLPLDTPVIGIIGGLNSYKNIIEFLKVLKKCNKPFHLLICGKAGDISEEEIRANVKEYIDKVTVDCHFLSDYEYDTAIVASDIIYSIYNYSFDGASGPLTDGVCAKKIILSSNHGSLGEIVKKNHLGYTANCNDQVEILQIVNEALDSVYTFQYDDIANNYRRKLSPQYFQERHQKLYTKLASENVYSS